MTPDLADRAWRVLRDLVSRGLVPVTELALLEELNCARQVPYLFQELGRDPFGLRRYLVGTVDVCRPVLLRHECAWALHRLASNRAVALVQITTGGRQAARNRLNGALAELRLHSPGLADATGFGIDEAAGQVYPVLGARIGAG